MKKLILGVTALFFLAIPALAEETPNHSIAVAGEAELLLPADYATITVGVVTQAKTVGEALAENNERMTRVITALRNLGIHDADIRTSKFNIAPRYEPQVQGQYYDSDALRAIIGYYVSNQVDVIVRDMTKVSRIVDAAADAGANSAGSIRFDLKNYADNFDKARKAAVESARHKAEVLAAAAHLELGRALSVTDNEADRSYDGRPSGGAETVVVTGSRTPTPTPILPEQVRIVARVTVLYAVK